MINTVKQGHRYVNMRRNILKQGYRHVIMIINTANRGIITLM